MFCGQCGNDVGEGAAVCSRCGARLPQDTGQAPAPPAAGQEYGFAPQGDAPQGGYAPQGGAAQGGAAQGGAAQGGYAPEGGAPQAGPQQGGYGAPAGGPGYDAPPGYPPAGGPQGGAQQGGYGAQQGGYGAQQGGYGAQQGGYAAQQGTPQAGPGYPPVGQQPAPGSYPPPGGPPQPGWSGGQAAAGTFSFDAKRWTPADMIVGGASLIVLISLFLPWFTASITGLGSGSESGTDGHGWLWIVFVIVLVILAFEVLKAGFATLPFTLPLQPELLLLIATGLNLLLVVIAFVAKPSIGFGVQVGWGVGAFLALIAAIVAVAPLAVALFNGSSASRAS